MADVVMPRLSDSMEEGTILQWLKQVGDEVAVGDELVEIETDKANMAYESDVAGTLTEILAEEGATLPIGTPIARVGDSAEGSSASAAGPDAASEGPAGGGSAAVLDPSKSTPPAEDASGTAVEGPAAEANASAESGSEQQVASRGEQATSDGQAADGRPKASPLARRMAKEKGLDLSTLHGSGPGGRIIKADIEKAAAVEPIGVIGSKPATTRPQGATLGEAAAPGASEKPETAKGTVQIEEPSKLQSTVARRMAESKATAPHFYLEAEVDMTRAVAARSRVKELAGPDLNVPSFNDMVVKAVGLALREHPRANGAYRDGRFELYSRVNVGVAVAARDALVVPTIFDADRRSLLGDRRRLKGARRARPRRDDHPAGALGRHLHRLQPGHVRE